MVIPKPGWLTEEPEQWPDDAREFFRLCHAILKRAQAGVGPAEESATLTGRESVVEHR